MLLRTYEQLQEAYSKHGMQSIEDDISVAYNKHSESYMVRWHEWPIWQVGRDSQISLGIGRIGKNSFALAAAYKYLGIDSSLPLEHVLYWRTDMDTVSIHRSGDVAARDTRVWLREGLHPVPALHGADAAKFLHDWDEAHTAMSTFMPDDWHPEVIYRSADMAPILHAAGGNGLAMAKYEPLSRDQRWVLTAEIAPFQTPKSLTLAEVVDIYNVGLLNDPTHRLGRCVLNLFAGVNK